MAVNQQRKIAMKRLKSDFEELARSPVVGVSAAPLESNMLEWHCNFLMNDTPFHLLLIFPDEYPYKSPSAEFVPNGFCYRGGATKPGKKGTQVCLSIFSDFGGIHTEWEKETSSGWSPGYTVQTVLLNVVSFLCELDFAMPSNIKLAASYRCSDCGHTGKKPFPAMGEQKSLKGKTSSGGKKTPPAAQAKKQQITDYISKEEFKPDVTPKSNNEFYGYGLVVSGPPSRPSLTSPCEFLSADSFLSMKSSVGFVHSILKEELKFFLPMFLSKDHGSAIKERFEDTLKEIAVILPKCNPKKTPMAEMVLKTIPNLMSATVVEFSKGTQHTSENHLCGYFALHRLLLWALETYPDMQKLVDDRLQDFIENQSSRSKKACPHIGEWLMLLAASSKYTWQEAGDAYLSESWRRNVMWYVKDDPKLGYLDTDQEYRLANTLQATLVSRKLLAFQVLFLDIAIPKDMTRKQIITRYDVNLGFPTEEMVAEMQQAVQKINNMKTYADWFKVLKLETPSDDEIFNKLIDALHFSLDTDGYKLTFFKIAGRWPEVLKRYEADLKSGKSKPWGKAANSGGGKGNDTEKTEVKEIASVKGKGRGKNRGVTVNEEAKASDEEELKTPGRGRGRGRGAVTGGDKRKADAPNPGRGRGKRARKQ